MAYSNETHVSDGTLQTIILSIAFFEKSEIHVYRNGVEIFSPVDFVWATANSIQFAAPQAVGVEIQLRRTTDISEMRHIFTEGAQFSNQTLDENYTQSLHIAQEAQEGGNLTDVFHDLDMHQFRVRNMAPGILPSDAATVEQITTLVNDNPNVLRSVRGPLSEGPLLAMPDAASRFNKLLSFDSLGNPVVVAPASGDATALALLLASSAGAGNVGAMGPSGPVTVQAALDAAYSSAASASRTFDTPEALAAATIPAGVAVVRTRSSFALGYQSKAAGGQDYIRGNGSRVSDGKMVVTSADGAQWIHTTLQPCLGNFGDTNNTDITDALSRFLAFSQTYPGIMDWTGQGYVTTSLSASVPDSEELGATYCREFTGNLRLRQHASIQVNTALTFTGYVKTTWDSFEMIGHQVYAQRTIGTALRLIKCKYARINNAYFWGMRRWGLDLGYYTTEFSFGKIAGLYNGANKFQRPTWNPTTSFAFGTGTAQRESIQGITLPNGIELGDGVSVNNRYYQVRFIDTGGRVDVFPGMSAVDRAALSADGFWVTGGTMRHTGEDTNAGYVAHFTSLVCGHACIGADLYPVSFGKFSSQLDCVSIAVGENRDKATRGGSIVDCYIESTDIFCVQIGQAGDSPYTIGKTGQFTPTVAYQWLDYKDPDGSVHPARQVPNVGTDFNKRSSAWLGTGELGAAEYRAVASIVDGNTPVTTVIVGTTWGREVYLDLQQPTFQAHGRRSLMIHLTSTDGAMSGNVRFRALNGSDQVNSAAFKDVAVTGPITLVATWNNGNWLLTKGPVHTIA